MCLYGLLSPIRIAHMYVCPGTTTWNRTKYTGASPRNRTFSPALSRHWPPVTLHLKKGH